MNFIQFILITCFITALLCNEAKAKTSSPESPENKIVIGKIDKLQSTILGEERELWIQLPEKLTKDKKYPVIYLLDAKSRFNSLSGILKSFSGKKARLNNFLPEMIIVGITNKNGKRTRDLTPTKRGENSGGGELFLDFIEKEVMPYIKNTYPAGESDTFIGHSFGGLTVINTLVSRPHLFQRYVAIDPSLWWDNQVIMKKAEKAYKQNGFINKSLFVAVANTFPIGFDMSNILDASDKKINTGHPASITHFINSIELNKNNDFAWKYYEHDSHSSVPFIATYDAMRYLFKSHTIMESDIAKLKTPETTVNEVITFLRNYYSNTTKDLKSEFKLPEDLVFDIARKLYAQRADLTHALLQKNIENYPNRASSFFNMGKYYEITSKADKAIEFLKKAVALGDNGRSKKLLKKLQSK